jgi:hypothetical protein
LFDFAFGLVGGVFDLGLEALEYAGEESFGIDGLLTGLQLVRMGDVAREVGKDDPPGEGVFPGSGAKADVLTLLGDPDPEDFEGSLVDGGGWWNLEVFVRGHRRVT